MMGDIAARPGSGIVLLQPAKEMADKPRRQGPARRGDRFLPQKQSDYVRYRALLDDKRAVHIGFAKLQFGIDQYRAWRAGRCEPHGNRRPAAVAESKG